jgi:hypothetical protein
MQRLVFETGIGNHCRTIGTCDAYNGILTVNGGDIRLKLYDFIGPITLKDSCALEVMTEQGWIASLLDTLVIGRGVKHGIEVTANSYELIVDTMLVGLDRWESTDKVSRIFFRLPLFEPILKESKAYRTIGREANSSVSDRLIFNIQLPEATVRSWCSATWVGLSENAENIVPWVEVQFTEAQGLREARAYVTRIARFFSLTSGLLLVPTEVSVSRYSEPEELRRVEDGLLTPEHSLYFHFIESEMLKSEAKVYASICNFISPEETSSSEKVLMAWLSRPAAWMAAESLQMQSLRERNTLGPNRLLSGSRWLEEIPGTRSEHTVSRDHARALGKLVERGAKVLGYDGLRGRFANAISKISKETNHERCSRLAKGLASSVGAGFVDHDIVEWVLEALRVRTH